MGIGSSTTRRVPSTPSLYRVSNFSGSPSMNEARLRASRSLSSSAGLTEKSPLMGRAHPPLVPPKGSNGHVSGGSIELDGTSSGIIPSPPLIKWIGPALLCALSYALYNIFIKKGSASIHPVLGGVILQFIAALLGSILLGLLVTRDGGFEMIEYDHDGIYWSIMAGIAVGAAEMISFFVSGMGVQAVQSIPIIIGGCVLFGAILGFLTLGEEMTIQGWLGIGLLIIGITLVATDPGVKMEAH